MIIRISHWTLFLGLALFSVESLAMRASYGERLCDTGLFECLKIHKGDTWESLFPDTRQRSVVQALNRTNVPLTQYSSRWLAVPFALESATRMEFAPFQATMDTEGRKTLIFDPKHLAWAAYDEAGKLVYWGPASGGKSWCEDVGRGCRTVDGDFAMIRKQGEGCKSSQYPVDKPGAPMPYCMHFHGGYAFHGSNGVVGYNASHGCVRLFTEDARWLNEEFIDLAGSGRKTTKVIVRPYS